jgi:hypothetical protein
VNTLARYAVEALGKVGDGSEEPLLLDLLRSPVARPLWACVLYSLGKTGKGPEPFQRALSLCSSDQVGIRQAALWCLGMLGSRERNLMPAAAVSGALGFLVDWVEREPQQDALRNVLFALGELGDRRPGVLPWRGRWRRRSFGALGGPVCGSAGAFRNLPLLLRFSDLAEAMVKGGILPRAGAEPAGASQPSERPDEAA